MKNTQLAYKITKQAEMSNHLVIQNSNIKIENIAIKPKILHRHFV